MENKSKSRAASGAENIKIEKLKDSKTEYDKSIKVILLGDSNVGKSSIIDRLKSNTFKASPSTTITLEHHNLIIKINSFILRMQIWDTAGQEKFDAIASTYYKSTDVVLFVYSINSMNSFERINEWAKQVDDNIAKDEQQIRILIGNKTDLEDVRKVSFQEGKNLSKEIKCNHFVEISCKDKENVDNNKNIDSIIEVIGKKFYNLWKVGTSERLNSSSFNYMASNSILEDSMNKKKKCC